MGNGTEGTEEAPLPQPARAGLDAIDETELRRRFMNRPAQDMANKQTKAALADAFFDLAKVITEATPGGRARSEALTCLETAALWVHQAIDRHETHKA